MMAETFFTIILTSVLAEGLWQILKELIPDISEKAWNYVNKIGSLASGIFIAVLTNVNIFTILNLDIKYPVIGVILTGIIISRGSNYVHDLMGKLQKSPKQNDI